MGLADSLGPLVNHNDRAPALLFPDILCSMGDGRIKMDRIALIKAVTLFAVNQFYPSLQDKEELLVALPLPHMLVEEEADRDSQALGNLGQRDPPGGPDLSDLVGDSFFEHVAYHETCCGMTNNGGHVKKFFCLLPLNVIDLSLNCLELS